MDVFQEILTALQTEDRIVLATIIATSGSTPAAALSKMLVKQGGAVSVGTVGGGCMEGDVLLHAHRLYESGRAEILTFQLNEDDAEAGLICGGNLDVLIEPLTKEHVPIFEELKSLRDDGEDCILASLLSPEHRIEWKRIIPLSAGKAKPLTSTIPHLTADLDTLIHKAHERQTPQRIELPYGELILEPIVGSPSLVLAGGGHVSKYVSRIAHTAGFRITIIDDREKFANADRFPEAARTLVADYAEVFTDVVIKPSTYIVIVTRGHRYDEIVLEQALKTPAKYIGMIGSKRKVLTTYDHLLKRGISSEMLKRVHAPIGIDIGAVTAEEIAVSIVAELIRIRRGSQEPLCSMAETLNASP
jgi:xanthine dehydrogenase accessory factor